MIPKIIHYFWFGGNPLPPYALKCIASWKKYLPEYEIRRWDESNFDVNCNPYVAKAYKARKFAFVSDYARLYILYKYGGIYFDTDVELINNISDIVARGPFFALENQIMHNVKIAPGLAMGADPNMPFIKEILDSYTNEHFIREDGTLNLFTINNRITNKFLALGWKPIDKVQKVRDFTIYSSEFFCPYHARTERMHLTPNSKAIHWYAGSWVDKKGWNPRKLKHIAKIMIPERILGWWLERNIK